MKKKNNKWLSATLAACMVLGSVPAYSYSWPVLAAETAVQEAVADGEIDTWKDSRHCATIPIRRQQLLLHRQKVRDCLISFMEQTP